MKVQIELDGDVLEQLRELAEAEGCTRDEIINSCIRRDLVKGEASVMRQTIRRQMSSDDWGL